MCEVQFFCIYEIGVLEGAWADGVAYYARACVYAAKILEVRFQMPCCERCRMGLAGIQLYVVEVSGC